MAESSSRTGRVIGTRQQRTGPLECGGSRSRWWLCSRRREEEEREDGRSRFGSGDDE